MILFSFVRNSSLYIPETNTELEVVNVYPPSNYKHNTYKLIEILANELNINNKDLFELMYFETAGTLNPKISNPNSSAKGMIQFTDASSRLLKSSNGEYYSNSEELIQKCGTIECQLSTPSDTNKYGGPVYQYLSRFKNMTNKQELYMSIFYPKAMNKSNFTFPKHIQNINPGIVNVDDYIKLAEQRLERNTVYVD